MTPDEHRERAEDLADAAASLYEMILAAADNPNAKPVGPGDWQHLDARIRLAELHLALSQHPPRHAPTNAAADYAGDDDGGYPGG